MQKLNKNDLIEIVAEEGRMSKRDAKEALEITFAKIEEALLEGQEVNISNFGVFVPKTRPSRGGADPKEHTPIILPESKTVVFRASKTLKEKLNK